MTTINEASLDLFGVQFKHLNYGQRLDLYRALQFGDELIDELESTFATPEDIADKISRQKYGVPEDIADKISRQKYGVPYDQLRFAGQKREVLILAIDYELNLLVNRNK